jgi:hypothetical protein
VARTALRKGFFVHRTSLAKGQEKQPDARHSLVDARSIQMLSTDYPPADERSYDVALLLQRSMLRRIESEAQITWND